MIYGFIICAGKQSRFKTDTPKALVDINGETLLDRNIRAMSSHCDKVFVVCSIDNEHYFKCDNKIAINSGKGSGDAVWQAMERVDIHDGDTCFIMWGDSMPETSIYPYLIKAYTGISIIPTVYEEKPYVQIIPVEDNRAEIRFSKFGEEITPGYHDLSVFYCNAYELLLALRQFQSQITNKTGTYTHKHGNEMEFLDVFNDTDMRVSVKVLKNYKDFSFNTIEELNSLIKRN